MRGLFFKIFIIFWIAQSLIFVISTALIVRRHFEGPEVPFETLFSTLQNEGNTAVGAYEKGGCGALLAYGAGISQTVGLADASGQYLCELPGTPSLGNYAEMPARIFGKQTGKQYIWNVPVTSSVGRQYVFLLSRPHVPRKRSLIQDLRRFSFPQLPVAIVVGGLMTFVLVLLLIRPVARLRKAARELAAGKLNARVALPPRPSRIFAEDEISALMRDFNHMAERLESLVAAQKLLLRDVSHELRSPLSRLSVALELAREDAGPAMATHLERIERETERLNLLIGQLLTLSSMEALEKLGNFEPVSLNRLIERLIPDAEYEARQRQCSVLFHATDECVIAGNESLLYPAIENVVRNAIRYTESGSVVDIELAAVTRDGERQAQIDISDRGPGIPENQLDAIFRPFHRVDYARSPNTGGFGVGLAIAERAVRLHNGEVAALNREGGGAIIRMNFPAIEDAHTARPAADPGNARISA